MCLMAVAAPAALSADETRVVDIDQSAVLGDAADGVVLVPSPDGGVQRFRVEPTRVAAPELQRRYPENRVFRGEGIDDPRARVMLGTGPQGFHAQVLTPAGDWYVDRRDDGRYLAYEGGATEARGIDQQPPITVPGSIRPAPRIAAAFPRTSGTQLRTYRFALATTGEYSAVFGGTKALVHAELIKAMARINGIYESEVSAHFELVANNDNLIYLNAATDPYSNFDGGAMLGENQTTVDSVIGTANYDLGHVFSTGGGGVAYLGVLGVSGYKAGGVTGSPSPTGDDFWVDYVAHEMGHQMGGDHTFQGNQGSCSGNGVSAAAMEPGSGSTIMAYAGICGADDLQPHSDAYFNAKSYDQIRAVMEAASGTGTATSTGNSVPAITRGGAAFTVPPRTPLRLSATATDADSDAITYDWEQYNGGVLRSLATEPKTGGALFRSYSPVASGVRYLPKLSSVLAGSTNQATGSCSSLVGSAQLACRAEFLPTAARSMTFRMTARDDSAGGGGVATADTAVTVSGTTPFAITSQGSSATVGTGSSVPVTWDTAGTASSPYNVSGVDILLSDDAGATFGYTLATNTPNDGSQAVTVPDIADGASVRIMVRASGNIFYDVNNAVLTADDNTGPQIAITTPASGATYTQGQAVAADYACTDATALATCAGTVSDGAPIDTSTVGTKTFTVSATDSLSNASQVTHSYTVVAAPADPDPFVPPAASPPASSAPAVATPTPPPLAIGFGIDAWATRGASISGKGVTTGIQQVTATAKRGGTASFVVHVDNTGNAADAVKVIGPASSRLWRITYRSAAGADITAAVTRGGWATNALGAGTGTTVIVRVSPTTRARAGSASSRTITARSTGSAASDAVTLRTVVRR